MLECFQQWVIGSYFLFLRNNYKGILFFNQHTFLKKIKHSPFSYKSINLDEDEEMINEQQQQPIPPSKPTKPPPIKQAPPARPAKRPPPPSRPTAPARPNLSEKVCFYILKST